MTARIRACQFRGCRPTNLLTGFGLCDLLMFNIVRTITISHSFGINFRRSGLILLRTKRVQNRDTNLCANLSFFFEQQSLVSH
jgi:hypothetical protein